MTPKRARTVGDIRLAAYGRSGGRCERCGYGLHERWELHHRQLRSQGGDWSLSNLLTLHDACHRLVHLLPAKSYIDGYLVRGSALPASEPLHLFSRRWVLLSADGTYTENGDDDD